MKSNDNLIKYLNENFPPCDIPDLLKKNSLYFKFADQFADKRTEEKGMMLNRVLNSVNMAVACNIFSDLNEMNIEYISFKGFVLSQLLYSNPNERAWGDIDNILTMFISICWRKDSACRRRTECQIRIM